MGLIWQAAMAGSQDPAHGMMPRSMPMAPWPTTRDCMACACVAGAVLLSLVSAGCDLVSRVHSELKPGGLNLLAKHKI